MHSCLNVLRRFGWFVIFYYYMLRRQPVSTNQPPKSGALVTIQLSDLGSFATSSLDVYILKTQALAWRTRIVSLQGMLPVLF